MTVKMTVFWDAAPCSLVEVACCLHHQGDALMMEAANTSEMYIYIFLNEMKYLFENCIEAESA
jgi:hypothetical protein